MTEATFTAVPSDAQHKPGRVTVLPDGWKFTSLRQTIRVGLWVPIWCSGGVERYHLAVCKATEQFAAGIEWTCLCIDAGGQTMSDMLDLTSRHMAVTHDPDELVAKCDVIVVWAIQDISRLAGFVARGGKVVIIQHGDTTWSRIWMRATLQSTIGDDGEPFEFHSASVSQTSHALFDEAGLGSTILQAGIDLDRIAPSQSRAESRKLLGIAEGELAVGFVGRFSSEKNPQMVAKIVGQLGDGYRAIYHGYALGDDRPLKADLTQLSGGRATIVGREWHTGDIYRAIDCLVMASPQEAGPLVAIEAWLARVPLISTPVGVVGEHPQWAAIVNNYTDVSRFAVNVQSVRRRRNLAASKAELMDIAAQASDEFSLASLARRWSMFLKGLFA